jgi:MFS family permease
VIWTLGLVSLFMDVSSEMIHGLLPVYLVTILGTGALTVGIIEGLAEATASITKIFSGTLSDWLGKRQLLAAIGYGLSALSKPIFPLATSVALLIAARFIDRIGKGIRGAPRDALISDVTPAAIRGAAFGLRQSLDTVGAVCGPLLALTLMATTANNFKFVFWIAVIPAMLSFALISFGVRDMPAATAQTPRGPRARAPLQLTVVRSLPAMFWAVLGVASLLSLARVSEAFLILRAQQQGLAVALAPLVLVGMNVIYTFSAYPIGKIGDRVPRLSLMALGCLVLAVSQTVLALAGGLGMVAIGVLLYGLHLGLTQGLLAAMVADAAPAQLRGTAFGMFYLITGLAMLASGVAAGLIWDRISPSACFAAGASASLLALCALPRLRSASLTRA